MADYSADWISVDDELPHMNERVIVTCVNYTNKMDEHISVSTYFGNNQWSGHKKVTYWMPLPELPRIIQKRRVRYIKDKHLSEMSCKHYNKRFNCCDKTSELIEGRLELSNCPYTDDSLFGGTCCRYYEKEN